MKEEFWIPFTSITSQRLSYPEGLNFGQWPMSDVAHWFSMHVINLIIDSPVGAHNLYYLMGAGLICTSMGFLILHLGLGLPVALAAGLIYSALPFGIERIYHLWLSAYFQVPLIFYVLLNLNKVVSKGRLIFLGVVIGLTGIYFAFFASLLIGFDFILHWLSRQGLSRKEFQAKMKLCFWNSTYFLSTMIASLLLSLASSVIFILKHSDHGTNQRSWRESVIWGLDIENILTPPPDHWFPLYSQIRPFLFSWERLNYQAPFEGYKEYLGLAALAGMLMVIVALAKKIRRKPVEDIYWHLGAAVIWCYAWGLKYGLGTAFAYLVTPSIRSWNRISVFIATAGLIAFFYWLGPKINRISNQGLRWLACFALLVFCLAEQGTLWRPLDVKIDQAQSDREFSAKVKAAAQDKPILGLPFGGFPDWRGYASIEPYGIFRYLMYEEIRSVVPSIKGTPETARKFEYFFGRIPAPQFMRDYGLVGVVVDRHDYPDMGADVISALRNPRSTVFSSQDARFMYIGLEP